MRLEASLTAKLYSPDIVVVVDANDTSLEHARRPGVDIAINQKTPGGMPSTFELSRKLVGLGGALANIVVHGQKVTIFLTSSRIVI